MAMAPVGLRMCEAYPATSRFIVGLEAIGKMVFGRATLQPCEEA